MDIKLSYSRMFHGFKTDAEALKDRNFKAREMRREGIKCMVIKFINYHMKEDYNGYVF